MNAKTRKYSRTTYGSSRKVVKKIPWKIDKYNIREFLLITLCPCRAVFGNCYFWAIIDLPWCGMAYKQTIIMTSLHFGQNRENFVCTLNCNCTSLEPPHGLSSSVNFQRCLRNDEPKAKVFLLKLFTFCLFFLLSLAWFSASSEALLSHDLTSFFNVQWWKFARWVSSLAL